MLDRDDDALAEYRRAAQLDPNYVAAWSGEGLVYLKRHLWDEALIRFDKALSINPDFEPACQGRTAAQHKKDVGDRWKHFGGFLVEMLVRGTMGE